MNLPSYYSQLEESGADLSNTVRRFTREELTERSTGAWSPLEVLEHVYLAEAGVVRLLQGDAAGSHDGETVHGADKLKHMLCGRRDVKLAAPDFLEPKGRFTDLDTFMNAFTSNRGALRAALDEEKIRIDSRVFPHPRLGLMTTEDWLWFLTHHTQRHVEQLKDMKTALSAHGV